MDIAADKLNKWREQEPLITIGNKYIKDKPYLCYFLHPRAIDNFIVEGDINSAVNYAGYISCTELTFSFIHNGSININLDITVDDGFVFNLVLKDFPPILIETMNSLDVVIFFADKTEIEIKKFMSFIELPIFPARYKFAPGVKLVFSLDYKNGRAIANLYGSNGDIKFDIKSMVKVVALAMGGVHYESENGHYYFLELPENSKEQI